MPLKFLFWSLGLCLSGIPLAASIAATPSKFGDVFTVESYVGHEGEVLFIAVALGAVTVAEIAELAFDLEKSEKLRIGITAIIFCALFTQLILYAIWYGTIVQMDAAGKPLPAEEVVWIIGLVFLTIVEALVFKLVLWSRKA